MGEKRKKKNRKNWDKSWNNHGKNVENHGKQWKTVQVRIGFPWPTELWELLSLTSQFRIWRLLKAELHSEICLRAAAADAPSVPRVPTALLNIIGRGRARGP